MNLLGIKRGTWLSTYFQLYLGFFMSGLGHGIVRSPACLIFLRVTLRLTAP